MENHSKVRGNEMENCIKGWFIGIVTVRVAHITMF